MMSPLPGAAGTRRYTFTITPREGGDFRVAYEPRDRGTWNVFQREDATPAGRRAPFGPRPAAGAGRSTGLWLARGRER